MHDERIKTIENGSILVYFQSPQLMGTVAEYNVRAGIDTGVTKLDDKRCRFVGTSAHLMGMEADHHTVRLKGCFLNGVFYSLHVGRMRVINPAVAPAFYKLYFP